MQRSIVAMPFQWVEKFQWQLPVLSERVCVNLWGTVCVSSNVSIVYSCCFSFIVMGWYFSNSLLLRIVSLSWDVPLRLSHMLGREAAARKWCSARHRCPSSRCSAGRGSTAEGSSRCRRHPAGSLRQGPHFSPGFTMTVTKIPKAASVAAPPTCKAAHAQRPEAVVPQAVVRHRQGVAGVVELTASDDPQVLQGEHTHRHVRHEDVAMHLHDALKKEQPFQLRLHSPLREQAIERKTGLPAGRRGRAPREGVWSPGCRGRPGSRCTAAAGSRSGSPSWRAGLVSCRCQGKLQGRQINSASLEQTPRGKSSPWK